ncbi:hypothetical protein VCUG_02143 [Vavraia culicis subsp. floridensis]|uniref:Uncharacterized protein n=1 Tax=Vavraia culicis (isolate floridensis) TaxID=948595 RepID=L2GRZ0_VAVCU|nr:uncharacterized protein VCUG_02143 [Vavraia culicis subsp. floridensis]ELA46379.2 hypothetical protein VCUG_02143 [Vavraia culicis subsp. floridensis]
MVKGLTAPKSSEMRRRDAMRRRMVSGQNAKDCVNDVLEVEEKKEIGAMVGKRSVKQNIRRYESKRENEHKINGNCEVADNILVQQKQVLATNQPSGVSQQINDDVVLMDDVLVKKFKCANIDEKCYKTVVKKELRDQSVDVSGARTSVNATVTGIKIVNDVAVQHKVVTNGKMIGDVVSQDVNVRSSAPLPASVRTKSNINANRTSPLKYFLFLDNSDSEEKRINQIIRMSLDYLSEQEESFKNLDLKIELDDKIVQEKIKGVECEIERCKCEIEKWEKIGKECAASCLKEGIKLGRMSKSTRHEEEDRTDSRVLTEQNRERIKKLALMMNKYIEACKNGCEEIYRKMFAMVKGSDLDPLLVLKTLAKLKRVDE